MCLAEKKKFKPTELGIGYKWVKKHRGRYYSCNDGSYYYRKGKWDTAEDVGQLKIDIGFHIFDKLEEAKTSIWRTGYDDKKELIMGTLKTGVTRIMVKVQYRKGYYHTGYGDGLSWEGKERMIVAKKMRILEEIK